MYVAALCHLYTPSEERGVFKTTDGGQNWKKVLYVGPNIGAVDLVIDPRGIRIRSLQQPMTFSAFRGLIGMEDQEVEFIRRRMLARIGSNSRAGCQPALLAVLGLPSAAPSRMSYMPCSITSMQKLITRGQVPVQVQVTRDGGQHWTDTTASIAAAGGPTDAWVTRVFPSRFDPATIYITKSRRRQDDFRPFVLRSTDFGRTWSMLTEGLTTDSAANVIAEDTVQSNLLFLGTDKGTLCFF